MSIKRSLIIIVLILNAFIAYYLVADIIRAFHHQHALVEEQNANVAMTDLLKSAVHWAMERGVTNAALSAVSPVDSARRSIIEKNRSEADKYYVDALKHIQLLNEEMDKDSKLYHLIIEQTRETQALFNKVEALREKADANMVLPAHQRDASVKKNWLPTMTNLILTRSGFALWLNRRNPKARPCNGCAGRATPFRLDDERICRPRTCHYRWSHRQ